LLPDGEVVLAHPLLLKSIWNMRAKTDKRDAEELAELLRSDRIPRAYIPPERYQGLRDLTRERARMVWGRTEAENALHSILWRTNIESRFASLSGNAALGWLESVELPVYLAPMRDERVARKLAEICWPDVILRRARPGPFRGLAGVGAGRLSVDRQAGASSKPEGPDLQSFGPSGRRRV